MGNSASTAMCEEKQEEDQLEQQQQDDDVPEESGPPADEEEGTGSKAGTKPEQKSAPKSPARKNVGDDEGASAKETESAKKQAAGAQASSKAGQEEVSAHLQGTSIAYKGHGADAPTAFACRNRQHKASHNMHPIFCFAECISVISNGWCLVQSSALIVDAMPALQQQ